MFDGIGGTDLIEAMAPGGFALAGGAETETRTMGVTFPYFPLEGTEREYRTRLSGRAPLQRAA